MGGTLTLPSERYRALNRVREFLRSLLDPKQTPRVPSQVRKDAYWCLKHYPGEHEVEWLAEECPQLLKKEKL